jgi:hypothetical protein
MKETRKFWSEKSREVSYLKHLRVDRRVLSKTVFGKTGCEVFSGFSWLTL